jgi:hypothetical protein
MKMANVEFLKKQVQEADARVSEIGNQIAAVKSRYVTIGNDGIERAHGISRQELDAKLHALEVARDQALTTFHAAQAAYSQAV